MPRIAGAVQAEEFSNFARPGPPAGPAVRQLIRQQIRNPSVYSRQQVLWYKTKYHCTPIRFSTVSEQPLKHCTLLSTPLPSATAIGTVAEHSGHGETGLSSTCQISKVAVKLKTQSNVSIRVCIFSFDREFMKMH
jgi:hypothetical protein